MKSPSFLTIFLAVVPVLLGTGPGRVSADGPKPGPMAAPKDEPNDEPTEGAKQAAKEAEALAASLPRDGTLVKEFRVCGDPSNLPFSNEKREGVENKIADVVAKDLGLKLVYTWWPHQRGVVKRVLNTRRCDVMLGIPKGYDLVAWTKPYYRTGYVIAYRKDRALKLKSLDDPRLKTLKVGVLVNTPPHDALGARGITGDNVIGYQLMFDSNFHAEDYPGK